MHMLRLMGEVVRYERKPWTMEGRSGIARTARVLVGRADFVDVSVPEDQPEPRDGDRVDWAIRPGVNNGRLRLTLLGQYTAVVPDAPRVGGEPAKPPVAAVR